MEEKDYSVILLILILMENISDIDINVDENLAGS
jgi:hypothetical protein